MQSQAVRLSWHAQEMVQRAGVPRECEVAEEALGKCSMRGVAMLVAVAVFACAWTAADAQSVCNTPNAEEVRIGDTTHVCVNFNGVARSYFTPVSDRMTRLQFNGSE